MKSKRPWKGYAKIERIEFNSGDVKFRTGYGSRGFATKGCLLSEPREFESLDAAVGSLDAWWADWWPKQEKSRRRA